MIGKPLHAMFYSKLHQSTIRAIIKGLIELQTLCNIKSPLPCTTLTVTLGPCVCRPGKSGKPYSVLIIVYLFLEYKYITIDQQLNTVNWPISTYVLMCRWTNNICRHLLIALGWRGCFCKVVFYPPLLLCIYIAPSPIPRLVLAKYK